MTRGTCGLVVDGELTLVNVRVTRLAVAGKSDILDTLDPVHHFLLVTVGTLHVSVFPCQWESCPRVVEGRHFPFDGGVTLSTTMFDHLVGELSFVEIRVARVAPESGEMKDHFLSAVLSVAVLARNRDVGPREGEPRFLVLTEGERGRFESFDGMAHGAVVGVYLPELSVVIVGVAIRTLFERKQEFLSKNGTCGGFVALFALQLGVFALKLVLRQGVVEAFGNEGSPSGRGVAALAAALRNRRIVRTPVTGRAVFEFLRDERDSSPGLFVHFGVALFAGYLGVASHQRKPGRRVVK